MGATGPPKGRRLIGLELCFGQLALRVLHSSEATREQLGQAAPVVLPVTLLLAPGNAASELLHAFKSRKWAQRPLDFGDGRCAFIPTQTCPFAGETGR